MTFVTRVRAGVALALWMLLAALTPLRAEAEPGDVQFGGHDWYMTTSGVLAFDVSDSKGADPSGGASVGAGFRFNRWLATEIGGEWVDQVRYDRGTGAKSCQGTGGRANGYSTWQLSAGGRLYFTDAMIQPFVLGHGGFMKTRDHGGGRSCHGSGFVARMGAGVDVFVTNGLAISLTGTYVLPATGGARDHEYVSVGLGIIWY